MSGGVNECVKYMEAMQRCQEKKNKAQKQYLLSFILPFDVYPRVAQSCLYSRAFFQAYVSKSKQCLYRVGRALNTIFGVKFFWLFLISGCCILVIFVVDVGNQRGFSNQSLFWLKCILLYFWVFVYFFQNQSLMVGQFEDYGRHLMRSIA